MVQPLDGIRVLDLTTVLSGPFCTMMLADAGADVIKVEPPDGDSARRMGPPFWGGDSCEFIALNRNKRSIVLNLKEKQQHSQFLDLCRTADVVVENYRAGVPERLGIGYDDIAAVNPRIIVCSISGFGRNGPRREQPAYDAIMQAFTGIMAATGEPGGDPVRVNTSICDIGAAMYANQAVLLALAAREKTGRGQHVEASMFDTQVAWMLYRAVGYFATGSAPAKKMGSAAPHVVPYQAYPTSDSHIIIGALNDKLYRRLAEAMEVDDLVDDPRFVTNAERVANREALNEILRARFQEEDSAFWVAHLTKQGVPNSRVNSIEDVLNDPQTEAREMIATVEHARLGTLKFPASAVKLSDTPCTVRRPPPELGEHQAEILSEIEQ
jgi:crotonobetainyl-CoA:carnitine CoA-transferase CaiB-like acyl-CoA transferase